MKKNILSYFVAVILSSQVNAAIDFKKTVDLAKDKISVGDTISDIQNGIISNDSKNNLIDLGHGSIKVTVENTNSSTDDSVGVSLKDTLSHNLGKGSEIAVFQVENKANVIGLEIDSLDVLDPTKFAQVKADGLKVLVANTQGHATGIHLSHVNLDLGSGSTIDVSGTDLRDTIGMKVEGNSDLKANNLKIKTTGGNGLFITEGSKVDIGDNSQIISTGTAVKINKGGTFQAGKNLYINNSKNDGYAVIVGGGRGNNIDLGDGAIIETSGQRSTAIALVSSQGYDLFKAKNLSIKNTGEESVGIYVGHAGVDIDGLSIESRSGDGIIFMPIYGESTSPDDEDGEPKVRVHNALLKINNGNAAVAWKTMDLDNVEIEIQNTTDQTKNALTAASSFGKIVAKDVFIHTDGNENNMLRGAYSYYQGQIELKGNTRIHLPNAVALEAFGKGSLITVDGLVDIQGDIHVLYDGKIDLNTTTASTITGAILPVNDKCPNLEGCPFYEKTINWIGQGSTWNVTDDSKLNLLALSHGSHVNFAHATDYNTVEVEDLAGAANFNFKVDFDNQQSDKLKITHSSSGEHTVSLFNNGSANTDGTEKITIIETVDGKAEFKSGGEYEFGGYLYGVQRVNADPNSMDWEVVSTGEKTNPAKASVNTIVGNYLLNLAEHENISKRMGELRADDQQSGSWIRSYGGKFNSFDSSQLNGFGMNYYGLQAGVDHQIVESDHANWYVGGSLAYSNADQDYQRGSGKQKSYSGTAYLTYSDDKLWYADLYLKYAHYQNKLNVQDSLGQAVKGKGNADGLTVSTEVGRTFKLNHGVYLQPNVQFMASHLSSDAIKASNGLDVNFADLDSVVGRVGTKLGYQTLAGNKALDVYAKVNYAYEFDAKQQYSLNGSPEELDFGGHWIEYGIGASAFLNKQHALFVEANGNAGNRFDKYHYNVGYKFMF